MKWLRRRKHVKDLEIQVDELLAELSESLRIRLAQQAELDTLRQCIKAQTAKCREYLEQQREQEAE